MKDKKRGVFALLIILVLIGVGAYASFVGFGSKHKLSAKNIILGLDLNGGVSISYEAVGDNPTDKEMKDTISKMQSRAEVYSSEASVVQEGDKRIVIDIPGVDNAEEVLATLGKEGELVFVHEADVKVDEKTEEATYDKDKIICTGSDVLDANGEAITSETGAREYVVSLEFNENGTEKFAEATKKAYADRSAISIIYDHKVLSSPTVQAEITDGKAQISGNYKSKAEAEELASGIRIGALPIELKEVESKVVDAQLGQGALSTGVKAGIIGFILVILFMIIFYRLPGFASSLALCFFLVVYLLAINGLNITLTLPGIAGVILNIGMAVDANVVIFSRIREELADGKTVNSAIKQGFSKATSAIVDGNITTIIAAIVLYLRGSGTVKGFAITLALGIIISMFTALVITRLLLNAFCVLGVNDIKFFGVQKKAKKMKFVENRKISFCISGILIITCAAFLIMNKSNTGNILNFGLEFKGGTSYKITFNDDTEINDTLKKDIEDVFKNEGGAKQVILSKVKSSNTLQVQTNVLSEDDRNKVTDKIEKDYDITTKNIAYENISGSISNEMRTNAIVAVILAIILMLIYIAFRFKDILFATSAVVALCHDIIMVLLFYAASKTAVGNTFIAVMLTILGYSINSTIVIFDRVRENLKGKRRTPSVLKEVVDDSVSSTLSRSINTNLTTFFTLLALVVFGVSTIREFALPLMVGVIAGAYSSVFVTGPLWYTFKTGFKTIKASEEEEAAAAAKSASKKSAPKAAPKSVEEADTESEAKSETKTTETSNNKSSNNSSSPKKASGSRKKRKKKKGQR